MTSARLLAILALALSACSPPATPTPKPPNGFPDLNDFTAVDPADFTIAGGAVVTPSQVSCSLAEKNGSIVCSGNIRGMPASAPGSGCPVVRRTKDSPYSLLREEPDCASSGWSPIAVGHELTEKIGTCAVGEGDLVACIDADGKHGFVLEPSGSWVF